MKVAKMFTWPLSLCHCIATVTFHNGSSEFFYLGRFEYITFWGIDLFFEKNSIEKTEKQTMFFWILQVLFFEFFESQSVQTWTALSK